MATAKGISHLILVSACLFFGVCYAFKIGPFCPEPNWAREYRSHGWKQVCRGCQAAWINPKDGSVSPIYQPVKIMNQKGEIETVWEGKYVKP